MGNRMLYPSNTIPQAESQDCTAALVINRSSEDRRDVEEADLRLSGTYIYGRRIDVTVLASLNDENIRVRFGNSQCTGEMVRSWDAHVSYDCFLRPDCTGCCVVVVSKNAGYGRNEDCFAVWCNFETVVELGWHQQEHSKQSQEVVEFGAQRKGQKRFDLIGPRIGNLS